eukprot:6492722-Amphidinium_carterae.1
MGPYTAFHGERLRAMRLAANERPSCQAAAERYPPSTKRKMQLTAVLWTLRAGSASNNRGSALNTHSCFAKRGTLHTARNSMDRDRAASEGEMPRTAAPK